MGTLLCGRCSLTPGPLGTYGRDGFFFHHAGHRNHWASITAEQIPAYRADLIDYLHHLNAAGTPVVWSPSLLQPPHQTIDIGKPRRGVLYSGGGAQLDRIRISLNMLRTVLKSTLPIEIFHWPGEMDGYDGEAFAQEFGGGIVFRQVERMGGARFGMPVYRYCH